MSTTITNQPPSANAAPVPSTHAGGSTIIDTKKVRPRTLNLQTPRQALEEAQRLALLAREDRLVTLGNWSAGQVFAHLAWWVESIDEDKGPKPPWFIKLLGPLMKKKMLTGHLPTGFRLPGSPSGTYGDEPCELEEGLARFAKAMARLERNGFPNRHPVFGSMSGREWVSLHLRHAELHLGFLDEKKKK